jgi:phage baseplate assembly protein W
VRQPVGLHFVHPDLDTSVFGKGLVTTPAGRLEWVQGEQTVRQALLLLLSTRPGERVMRPEYGCDLHRLVFEPNDETTAGVAIYHVRRAIERWEPRVEILHLDANPDPDEPGLLEIVLEYRVRFLPETHRLSWSVFVSGEGVP